jgi:NitT/TauT family transport system ATP-binding protein
VGQASFSPDALAAAKAVFRPDLYDTASGSEGWLLATPVPMPSAFLLDRPFVADDLARYLAGFQFSRRKPDVSDQR